MNIGLHDAEMEHIRHKSFPNYALMKISAWHKAQGGIHSNNMIGFIPARFLILPQITPTCRKIQSVAAPVMKMFLFGNSYAQRWTGFFQIIAFIRPAIMP